jgi:hypothetical protein
MTGGGAGGGAGEGLPERAKEEAVGEVEAGADRERVQAGVAEEDLSKTIGEVASSTVAGASQDVAETAQVDDPPIPEWGSALPTEMKNRAMHCFSVFESKASNPQYTAYLASGL